MHMREPTFEAVVLERGALVKAHAWENEQRDDRCGSYFPLDEAVIGSWMR